ncbi:MAG TPA: TrmH family RNA methyltransferase [Aggregatilineales bacterium]|jgi:TrmH family RNA methyltransferase|nr:TrmH family RNA methyltransferase [Chloroflexota bacterium]HOA24840.1 TrmH family RNA methyltransferase [Aggregatilineales bacterium]HPV07212.1 TrmH family RNA methyltransferase [Aggregatilineales bacterium]HQA67060.1 TrmH family RNA methyltransferase [Aggregatilineales bacterium]HQE18088.1 TrmH family RNA methyltransferase [Aggregatilineales bacterium]
MTIRLKSYRKNFEHSYSFGVFTTIELLEYRPEQAVRVLIHSKGEGNAGVGKIRALCAEHGIPFEVADSTVERLAQRGDTYAIGVFRKAALQLNPAASHLVLVNPGDMGNLGTILRTMQGFGISDLAIIPPAADIYDPRVVRASMGALFRTRFAEFESIHAYREAFKDHALYSFMTDGTTRLQEAWFTPPFALIFGNESAGLPDEFRTLGTSVTIPHTDAIDSLNLAIAVGIALYESTKASFAG